MRLTIDNDFIYGGIQTDKGLMMLKQLKYILNDQSIPPGILVMYHSKDVKDEGGYCATPDDISMGSKNDKGESTIQSTTAGCKVLEIALDCDDDYESIHGSNSINQMLGEINMVRGVYEDELDAIISVTAAIVFTGSQYTSTNSNTILTEINSLWTTSPQSVISRDLVHHFSGKVLLVPEGRILGQASSIGSVCVATNPHCFTADSQDGFYTAAHEIGHLLNAIHSDGINCGSSTTQSIMCWGEVNQMFFSPASLTRINNYIDSKSCMDFNSANIIGPWSLCLNQTSTYTLNVPLNSTVVWSLTNSHASIQSGQGTGSVVVKGVSSGQVNLKATIDYPGNICGQIVEMISIQIGPSLSMYWTPSGTSGDLDVTVFGGSSPWTFYKNGSPIHTAYLSNTIVPFGCSSGLLTVSSTTSCGTGTYNSSVSGQCYGGYSAFSVHPNPATSEINVSVLEEFSDWGVAKIPEIKDNQVPRNLVLSLLDFTGNPVREISVNRNTKNIKMEVSTLPKGIYFLKIVGRELNETHKVIVE
ncbi:MAG: zinc-dependent metalloprotease [Flavobacteriaceae bacterium]